MTIAVFTPALLSTPGVAGVESLSSGLQRSLIDDSLNALTPAFRESVGNKMTLSAVDNAIIEPELLGDTHGGEDIIGAVGMNMHLHMLLKQRSESFELCVELAARLIFLIYSRVFVNCSLIIAAVAILVLGAIFSRYRRSWDSRRGRIFIAAGALTIISSMHTPWVFIAAI